MTTTTLESIKKLRQASGAGVQDCRKALERAEGQYEQALQLLRAQAAQAAARRDGRAASQGRVEVYSHGNGRIGVLLEINTETDFAASSQVLTHFAHEAALQVAAAAPLYVSEADIPAQALDEEARLARERALSEGKSAAIAERVAAGRLEAYRDRTVLLRQAYIRDEKMTMAELLHQVAGAVGEKVVIRRFVRWEIHPDEEN